LLRPARREVSWDCDSSHHLFRASLDCLSAAGHTTEVAARNTKLASVLKNVKHIASKTNIHKVGKVIHCVEDAAHRLEHAAHKVDRIARVFMRDEEADLSERNEDEDLLTRAIEGELHNRDFQDLVFEELTERGLAELQELAKRDPNIFRKIFRKFKKVVGKMASVVARDEDVDLVGRDYSDFELERLD